MSALIWVTGWFHLPVDVPFLQGPRFGAFPHLRSSHLHSSYGLHVEYYIFRWSLYTLGTISDGYGRRIQASRLDLAGWPTSLLFRHVELLAKINSLYRHIFRYWAGISLELFVG
jgi:hypothetical protein